MRALLKITKALSDASRARMLMALAQGELCVCQLTELTQLAPSTVSKHLSILHDAGLVDSRKEGRWIYYRLPPAQVPPDPVVSEALDWVAKSLEGDEQIRKDLRELKRILKTDPVELCKKQCNK